MEFKTIFNLPQNSLRNIQNAVGNVQIQLQFCFLPEGGARVWPCWKGSYCKDSGPTKLLGLRNTATRWGQLTSPWRLATKPWSPQLDPEHSLQAVAIQYNTTDESLVTILRKPQNEYRGKIVDNNQAGNLEHAARIPLRRLGDCENRVQICCDCAANVPSNDLKPTANYTLKSCFKTKKKCL